MSAASSKSVKSRVDFESNPAHLRAAMIPVSSRKLVLVCKQGVQGAQDTCHDIMTIDDMTFF